MDRDGPSVTSSGPQTVPVDTQQHPLTTQSTTTLCRGNGLGGSSHGALALH